MKDKYGLEFSDETLNLMNEWNKSDPIDGWEKERVKRIERYKAIELKFISSQYRTIVKKFYDFRIVFCRYIFSFILFPIK